MKSNANFIHFNNRQRYEQIFISIFLNIFLYGILKTNESVNGSLIVYNFYEKWNFGLVENRPIPNIKYGKIT